jgi:hypothetical protein
MSLLKHAGSSGVCSAYSDLPREAVLAQNACQRATLFMWELVAFAAVATGLTTALIPLRAESLSPGLRGTIRFGIALLVVIFGTAAGCLLLDNWARHFK